MPGKLEVSRDFLEITFTCVSGFHGTRDARGQLVEVLGIVLRSSR